MHEPHDPRARRDGGRRPVVLVHGVRTSSAIWRPQVRAITHLGHPCRCVDLPGHGARRHERFTFAAAVAAIDDAVRSCPRPPLLVGLSLGGYASLAYAARNPGTVAGVMLAGCSTEIRGKPLRAYRRLWRHVARALDREEGAHVVSDMLHAMHGHSSLADLRRLEVPVWLVNGQRDVLRMDERRFLAAHTRARLTVVPGAGHDVNSHAPVAFTRLLLDVVAELDGRHVAAPRRVRVLRSVRIASRAVLPVDRLAAAS